MSFLVKLFNVFTKKVEDSSPKGRVDSTDLAKVVRTSVYVGLAACLTYFMQGVTPEMIGTKGLVVLPLLAAVVEFLNKAVKDNT